MQRTQSSVVTSSAELIQIEFNEIEVLQGFCFMTLPFFLLFYSVIFSKRKMFALAGFPCKTIDKHMCQREGQYYIQ